MYECNAKDFLSFFCISTEKVGLVLDGSEHQRILPNADIHSVVNQLVTRASIFEAPAKATVEALLTHNTEALRASVSDLIFAANRVFYYSNVPPVFCKHVVKDEIVANFVDHGRELDTMLKMYLTNLEAIKVLLVDLPKPSENMDSNKIMCLRPTNTMKLTMAIDDYLGLLLTFTFAATMISGSKGANPYRDWVQALPNEHRPVDGEVS